MHCTSYNNSGYGQGQLIPSGDLNFDKMAMLSSSTFSNIVPMYTVFKKGISKLFCLNSLNEQLKFEAHYLRVNWAQMLTKFVQILKRYETYDIGYFYLFGRPHTVNPVQSPTSYPGLMPPSLIPT